MLLSRVLLVAVSFIFPLYLTGCSTTIKVAKVEKEQIISLAMDDNNLYFLGKNHDYQFSRDKLKQLEHFIQSPYAKKMTLVEASARAYGKNSVTASLTLLVSPNSLTEEEQQDLITHYGFTHLKDLAATHDYWKKTALVPELQKAPELLRRQFLFRDGKIVAIQNRQLFVDNYALSKPIEIDLEYLTNGSSFDGGNAAAVIAAPVVVIAAIPIYLVWGIMCSNNSC